MNTQNLGQSIEGTSSEAGMTIMLGFLVYSVFFSILVSFMGQVRRMFGPGTLLPMFFGKYFQPREEERIFMFLDLKSSTTIAEKMGNLKYSQFIQDCFHDLDKSTIKYQANLYQYVGDEAILTWKLKPGIHKLNCLQLFFDFKNKLKKKEAQYLKKYGTVPTFKAGIHVGKAIVSEIGGQKKELAYHGDVLNTTARIQGICNDFQKDFLASKKLIDLLGNNGGYVFENMGSMPLKGKSELVEVASVQVAE